MGLPDRHAGRDPRGRQALRDLLQEDAEWRRGPHLSHLPRGPERNASRPVHGDSIQSGRDAARSEEPCRDGANAMTRWLTEWLPRLVARAPATIYQKLLAAFLSIVVLLIMVGAVGLEVLSGVNRRAEEAVTLQRKIAAYRQLQHDTTAQLYSVTSALLVPDDRTLEATVRQLNQFGYDFDRLQFVAKDEVELLAEVRKEYDQFIQVVGKVVELIRGGKVPEGRALQAAQAGPLADRMERLTNQLVNRAEADMVASIEASQAANRTSQRIIIGFGVGSIALALVLGHVISWS